MRCRGGRWASLRSAHPTKEFLCVLCASVVNLILHRSGGAENDGALRGEDATIAVRNGRLGILHLARAAFAAQLPHRLDQQKEAVHPGVTVREAATIRVDRQPAAGRDTPARYERSALALRAEAEIFEKQYRVDRERVVELDDIDVLRGEPGHCIGLFSAGERAGDGQIRDARNIGVRDRLAAAERIYGRLFQ